MLYSDADIERVNVKLEKTDHQEEEEYISPFRRDVARLVHSTCFRRLQGKTQLFPSTENDFFRNRLTHSLEVAQIAKDIAKRINKREFYDKQKKQQYIDIDLVEFAALAHDIGHPPFGHQGEEALDECMRDFGGFEGNAQTLRLLSKIEKLRFLGFDNPSGINHHDGLDYRVGLNLTLRTLASVLKYDCLIPTSEGERIAYAKELFISEQEITDTVKPVKGYYSTEKTLVDRIKCSILQERKTKTKFQTVECAIMDLSDDIAYSTFDLEDGLKAGFYTPLDFITADRKILEKVALIVSKKIKIEPKLNWIDVKEHLNFLFTKLFDENANDGVSVSSHSAIAASYRSSKAITSNGYHRTALTERLVGDYIRNIEYVPDPIPSLSKVTLKKDALIQIEILKRFTYEYQIQSPKLKVAEYRGKDIVKRVFKALTEDDGHTLLPGDYRELFDDCTEKSAQKRIICDFVAGMTDRYLLEFYGRLFSEDPESIFKPI